MTSPNPRQRQSSPPSPPCSFFPSPITPAGERMKRPHTWFERRHTVSAEVLPCAGLVLYITGGALDSQSCPTLCDPLDYKPSRLLCPWDFLGKNIGVGCHFLLQRIVLTQASNPCLLHCSWILYQRSHQQLPDLQHSSLLILTGASRGGYHDSHCTDQRTEAQWHSCCPAVQCEPGVKSGTGRRQDSVLPLSPGNIPGSP